MKKFEKNKAGRELTTLGLLNKEVSSDISLTEKTNVKFLLNKAEILDGQILDDKQYKTINKLIEYKTFQELTK